LKRFISIIFFICLAFKPAYNIGFVSYYKLNLNTIIEKYCINKSKPKLKCNGKCYLKKQLQLTQSIKSNTSEEAILKSFVEIFFPVYFESNEHKYNIVLLRLNNKLGAFVYTNYTELLIPIQTPPPQV